ncbi:MAG: putative ABC exporter domain-containing protein [Planctomycetota bacterium]
MNRAILYLLLTQKKNSAREFLSGLRRPRRLIGLLFWLALIAGLLVSQTLGGGKGGAGGGSAHSGASPLSVLLTVLLAAALFGGLMQRGLAFRAADIDYLFAGPFDRRSLVLYRLLSLYPITVLSTLFLMIFLGPRLESPWWGLLGVATCQVIALHLQTVSSIVAATVSEKTFGKLRMKVQFILLLLVGGGLFCAITSFGGSGGLGAEVRSAFDSAPVRILFYPATAAGELSQAGSIAEALWPLLGLLLAYAVSLALVLGLQINFFEASLESSQQMSRVLSRVRSGVPIRSRHAGEKVREIRLPGLSIFRGGGAVFWKNLLNAGRSVRVIFFGLIMTAVFTSVILGLEVGSGGGIELQNVVYIGAALPFMLQQHVAFDFRRDIDCMGELRLLPASPTAIAAAEVAVPTLIALCYQTFLVLAAGFFVDLPPWAYAAPLLLYPPVTLAICTVTNIGFLMFPIKAVTASGRPNASGATLSALVNMLMLLICLVPAGAVATVMMLVFEQTLVVSLGAAVLTQYAVDLGMLKLLGHLFSSFDIAGLAREG